MSRTIALLAILPLSLAAWSLIDSTALTSTRPTLASEGNRAEPLPLNTPFMILGGLNLFGFRRSRKDDRGRGSGSSDGGYVDTTSATSSGSTTDKDDAASQDGTVETSGAESGTGGFWSFFTGGSDSSFDGGGDSSGGDGGGGDGGGGGD